MSNAYDTYLKVITTLSVLTVSAVGMYMSTVVPGFTIPHAISDALAVSTILILFKNRDRR